ncbi:MAG: metalloregulator ArsR/SmtB family transcription factor [Polyangiaceae bacterium]
MSELDATFAALSDPTRRGVIELLLEHPRRAGELADVLHVSFPAMSRHLRVLRQSGLVDEARGEQDSRVRLYRLRQEPFGELRQWLEHVEAFWSAELSSFKRHVEQRARKRGR